MTLKMFSLYELKKAALYPRKVYMRQKEKLEPGFMRSAMELHYYRPAFYKWLNAISADRLLLHEADLDKNSIVIDAGAYTGDWAQEILEKYSPTIYAFEPDPRNYKQLRQKMDSIRSVVTYSFGLGAKTETLHMTLEHLGSSMFYDASVKKGTPLAEVEIKDISTVWTSLALDRVNFMKINIEGAEFPLLERMIECSLVAKVDCFLIQFHEWHPDAYKRRRKIRAALSDTHRLVWDYHFVWEKWLLK